jgi:hypothetical protein
MEETNPTLAHIDLASAYAQFIRARSTAVEVGATYLKSKNRMEQAKQYLEKSFLEFQKQLRHSFELLLAARKQKWCSICKIVMPEETTRLMLSFTCPGEWPLHADSWRDVSHWSYLFYACQACYELGAYGRISAYFLRDHQVSFFNARFNGDSIELRGKEDPWFAMEDDEAYKGSLDEKRDQRMPKYISFEKAWNFGLITKEMLTAYGCFDEEEVSADIRKDIW